MVRDHKIYTIPNLLSFFRICLIPVLVWLYCVEQNYLWTAFVLLLSSLTDAADGAIARRFQMTSTLGKVLDPVADKLTQGAMLLCLFYRFPFMLVPLSEILIRSVGIVSAWRMKWDSEKSWHGKKATFVLYAILLIHLVWYDIPMWVSAFLVGGCMIVIMLKDESSE